MISRHLFQLAFLALCYGFAHWLFSQSEATVGDVWMQFVTGTAFFLVCNGALLSLHGIRRII
jgi:hypothetical protein